MTREGASCYECGYLVSICAAQFLEEGGEPEYVTKGLRGIPLKLRDLIRMNRLLAHQPWSFTPDDVAVLTQGRDPWSLSELVQAMVILIEYHTLSGAVLGFGINPELDLDPALLSRPPSASPSASGSTRGSAKFSSSLSPAPEAVERPISPDPVPETEPLPLSPDECAKASSGRSRLGSHKRFRAKDIPPNPKEVDETKRLAQVLSTAPDRPDSDETDKSKVMDLFDSAGFPRNAASYLKFSPRSEVNSHSSPHNSSSSSSSATPTAAASSSSTLPAPLDTFSGDDHPDGSPSSSSSYRTRARTHPSSSPRAREALVAAAELSRSAVTGSNSSARSHHGQEGPSAFQFGTTPPLSIPSPLNQPLTRPSGSLMHESGFFYDDNFQKYAGTETQTGITKYEDFDVRSQIHKVFSTTDYNFTDHGHPLLQRFYDGAGIVYEEELELAFNFTDNCLNGTEANTERFRLAVWRYVHRLFGIFHDDYDYAEVNKILNPSLKQFVKKVTCSPNEIKREDFQHMGFDLRPEEKLHMTLLALDARKEVSLLYGLHAVMKYTMRSNG